MSNNSILGVRPSPTHVTLVIRNTNATSVRVAVTMATPDVSLPSNEAGGVLYVIADLANDPIAILRSKRRQTRAN